MRSLPIFLSTLLSLSFVAIAPVAQAQSGEAEEAAEMSPEQARAAAREAYGEGQALFREGKHEESEAAFMRAYAIIPNPVVLLGVAEARQAQGNLQGAVEALETYLATREDAPDAEAVQAKIDEMKTAPATLVISSTPAGAAIVIDGEDTGEVTPAEIEVESGTHVVALTLEGREPAEQRVEAGFATRPEVALELAEIVAPEPTLEGDGEGLPEAGVDELDDVDEDDDGPGTAVWALSAVAAAGLVGGTVLGFLALTEESEFDDTPTESGADKGERYALFADVAFGLAAVAGISAIVIFLTADDDDDDEEEESEDGATAVFYPVASPTGAGLVGEVTF
ncbi:MAG: PEGA domain-containing protein [Deltaproteobacteria bacterium]|nr:PEGA domain-containing protein [Deltaproteobacteria bacterium]